MFIPKFDKVTPVRNNFDHERLKQIKHLYFVERKKPSEIADELGMAYSTLTRLMRRNGIK